jgi:hypothetical protein
LGYRSANDGRNPVRTHFCRFLAGRKIFAEFFEYFINHVFAALYITFVMPFLDFSDGGFRVLAI